MSFVHYIIINVAIDGKIYTIIYDISKIISDIIVVSELSNQNTLFLPRGHEYVMVTHRNLRAGTTRRHAKLRRKNWLFAGETGPIFECAVQGV